MFGLFRKSLTNQEVFTLIVAHLTNARAQMPDNSIFDIWSAKFLYHFEASLKQDIYKLNTSQVAYVTGVTYVCQLAKDELRNIIDKIVPLKNSPNLQTMVKLQNDLNKLFRSYGNNYD